MCRLLGATGSLEGAPFAALRSASEEHCDGWGLAWWGHAAGHVRSADRAGAPGSGFDEGVALARASESRILIAHIRQASVGSVTLANAHPYAKQGWAFAHNGTVRGLAAAEGHTDSETLFDTILPDLTRGADPIDAIRAAVAGHERTAVNVLLSDGRRLWALELHEERPDGYYGLFWTRTASGILVGSQGVAAPGWTPLGNGGSLVADGRECRVAASG